MRKSFKNILWSIAALSCGAMLYILLRPDTYIGKLFSGYRCIQNLQNKMVLFRADALRYYLPDMLWALALACSLQAVLLPKGPGIIIGSGAALLFGGIWELLQYSGPIAGTGDWIDIFMYFCGALASVIINMKEIRK